MTPIGSGRPGRALNHRLHPLKGKPQGATLYRERHKIKNMFGKRKDWRRIHTRYDRCAHTFFSAICIAATVIFWLNQ